ncbi:MAG TPA: Gfo/Idh/MocA family oxidoreductase [Candidatus Latescibacteria bacterium]|jgi:predicted dehydrogenase|nr:Gfo/Idh/MocA family oxidoreductase [Candidatus Latescibacterota bacterium]HJP33082.1 Gfo/Idh/MocA family oxidoreductase [Candidatus Latescibacterota bacterium]
MTPHRISLLGAGFISRFYTTTLHQGRGADRVHTVFSRSQESAGGLARDFGLPRATTDMKQAVEDPETDVIVIGLPNDLHVEAVSLAAAAGKAVLCTKPLGRTAEEAQQMLAAVESAGVFAGYLEDLVYPPKTLKAIASVEAGALGQVLWVRSRETHPGPHSDWFWDVERAGGGAMIDMGCHCVEIIRNFVGKQNRPVEAMCWSDTLVHPVTAEDHAIALIRFESGAIGQIEVSWAFRGGMDLRDEVSGTEGTIWLNHWLRTGFEMFTAAGKGGYVAEKAEQDTGWLFPVGDEAGELGYTDMFADMFAAMDEERAPRETFWDGYVVNAVTDACYASARSKRWEPIAIDGWRGGETPPIKDSIPRQQIDGLELIKEEVMPDGRTKRLLHDPATGRVTQQVV